MEKYEIIEEILSEIKIELDETLFYIPGEAIKGKIKLYPGVKINIKDNILHFTIKLLQFEFWEYNNTKTAELKNIHKVEVLEKLIEYQLKEEELSNFEERAKIGDFSIILLEKEKTEKEITIPFEFKLNEDNEKLLPTFQFETDTYFLGIRHLLTVNNKEYCSKNHIGLFIGKHKNLNLLKKKEIKNNSYAGLGILDAKVILPKEAYYFGEEMSFQIDSTSNLLFKKVTDIQSELNRKIEWVGYMRNTLVDKKTLQCENLKYNKDKYGLMSKLKLPADIAFNIGYYYIFGDSLGILGLVAGIYSKLSDSINMIKEIMKLDAKTNDFNENQKLITQFNESSIKTYEENDLKKIVEELKKFVYFKDNKVVGFVKFIRDITPPVKGYYFNCYYKFKINFKMAGMLLNQERSLDDDIDFYDGEEYIKNMKKLLSVN